MMNVYMGSDVEEFIFSEGTSFEDYNVNVTDEEMNEFGVIECVEEPEAACYRIALENAQNYHSIMEAMMTREINLLEAGETVVYEAGRIREMFEAVKKQIQKFWAKVKGVFKKVMDKIGSIVLSNKAFVKKYRPIQSNFTAVKKDKEFEGYPFPESQQLRYEAVATGAKTAAKGVNSEGHRDALKGTLRSALIGSNTSNENFAENLREKLYGASATRKMKISSKSFKDLLSELENCATERKNAKDAYKEAEKAVKKLLSEAKEAQSDVDDEDTDGAKKARLKVDAIQAALNIMSEGLSVQSKAIVARAIQTRKHANYYVTNHKVEKPGVEHSSAYLDEGLGIEII